MPTCMSDPESELGRPTIKSARISALKNMGSSVSRLFVSLVSSFFGANSSSLVSDEYILFPLYINRYPVSISLFVCRTTAQCVSSPM